MSEETTGILPVGIYCLQNRKAMASFMNLTDGKDLVQAHTLQDDEEFGNQYWFIKMHEQGVYTLRNIRTGNYLEVDGGLSADSTLVYCRPVKDSSKVPDKQKWKMWTKEGRWRLQNVASENGNNGSGYLDLKDGSKKENATIQIWHKNSDDAQRWNILARSQTADEIKGLVKKSPIVKAATNALPDYVYMQMPQDVFQNIWAEATKQQPEPCKCCSEDTCPCSSKGSDKRTIFDRRDGVYDWDAIAVAYKNAVNNWARKNLKLDGYYVLCGLAFGDAGSGTSATVWMLSQDMKGVQYFNFGKMGVQDEPPKFSPFVAFF